MKFLCVFLLFLVGIFSIKAAPYEKHHHHHQAGGTSFDPVPESGTSFDRVPVDNGHGHGHGQVGTSFEPVDTNQHTSGAQRG